MPQMSDFDLAACPSPLTIAEPQAMSGLTIFCDFDGPLVDVSDRYYTTYQLALTDVQEWYEAKGEPLPLHCLTKEQFWRMKRDRLPDIEIALRSGLRNQQIEQFLQRVQQIVNQPTLLHQDTVQPGVRWALTTFRNLGAQLVLVTLRQQVQVLQVLQDHGLLHLFDAVCGVSAIEVAYLNPVDHKVQLLAEALAQEPFCRCSREHAWMIGDTEADILAGQAAGISTIALTCGIRSSSYLRRFDPSHLHNDLRSAAHELSSRYKHTSSLQASSLIGANVMV
ncbi:MAG: HAD family hydrolase [Leptolyngbyaceae cyanobacterium SL_7_1]|nr:HAD family hydrolase [Leptolyngbyaceae cyanobacterium SL_7_1]